MALEKTVLSAQSICELLKEQYDIVVTDIERLPLGSANCYRISDGGKNYFLKELQSKFSEDKIIEEVLGRQQPQAAATELLSLVVEQGAPDNVTIITVQL